MTSHNPNSLDVHKFPDAKFCQLASVAGVLYSSEWQSWIRGYHAINKNTASFDTFNKSRLFRWVVGPGCRTKSKRRGVGNRYSLFNILHAEKHCHWSEYLLTRNGRCGINVIQNGWFIEVTRTI